MGKEGLLGLGIEGRRDRVGRWKEYWRERDVCALKQVIEVSV